MSITKTIRILDSNHLDQIMPIEEDSFDHPWTHEQIQSEIEDNKYAKNFGLFDKDVLLAYCLCHLVVDELHINNIAVDKKHRKKGLASHFIDLIIKESNCSTAYLEVNVKNIAAINLYKKFGFKDLYTRNNYYPDGSDATVMIY